MLEAGDRRRIDEIREELSIWNEANPPVLEQVASPLRQLLDCDQVMALGVTLRGSGLSTSFLYGVGFDTAELGRRFETFLADKRVGWTGWNPFCPLPRDRNRAISVFETLGKSAVQMLPVYREVIGPTSPLAGQDQLRMLVCEGSRMLAWIGGFVPTVEKRQRLALQALAAPLARRLIAERTLEDGILRTQLIGAALEKVAAPSFLLRADGAIAHANSAGQALVDSGTYPDHCIPGTATGSAVTANDPLVTQIRSVGLPDHFLVVYTRPDSQGPSPVAACVARWKLTARQTEVLALLLRGLGNRDIALRLSCSESTVEFHVTNLLYRSDCGTRAELAREAWIAAQGEVSGERVGR